MIGGAKILSPTWHGFFDLIRPDGHGEILFLDDNSWDLCMYDGADTLLGPNSNVHRFLLTKRLQRTLKNSEGVHDIRSLREVIKVLS